MPSLTKNKTSECLQAESQLYDKTIGNLMYLVIAKYGLCSDKKYLERILCEC